PVLIIGTYRDVELDVARPLAQTLEELLRQRLAHRIALRRLPQDSVSAMLRALSGQEPPKPLVDAVYSETEGNPFFVEEVFQHLAEEGRLFDAKGRWRTDLEVSELDVPEGVRLVIGRRLERVGEECRRVLTAAAVIGRGFSFELLEAMSDVETDALLDAVDEAERAQLITAAEDGPPDGQAEARFRFAHELIRQTLVSGLSLPRRQRLHLRVAEAVERLYGRNVEEHAADLAHHLYQAGSAADPEKTVRYLTLAGQRALAAVGYEESAHLYQMALQALDLEEKPDEAQRCELLLGRGEAEARAGDSDTARETFGLAADIAKKLGIPEHLARAAVGYGGRFVWGGVVVIDERWVGLLEEALSALGPQDSVLHVRVLASLAVQLYWDMSVERSVALSQKAVEMARRIGDPAVLAYALDARYAASPGLENAEERLAIATEIVRLADEAGDKERAHQGHHWRFLVLMGLGDIPAADLEIEAQVRLAEELRQPSQLWYTAVVRAMRDLLAGRFEEAEQLAQEGLAIGQRTEPQTAMAAFTVQMFALRKEQGRLGEMEAAQKALAPQYPKMPFVRTMLALIYTQLGREAEARDEFERLATSDFADLPRDFLWMACVTNLAETCAFLHDAGRAATLYRLLLPYAAHNVLVAPAACNGSASRYLGLLAATMSRWDEAVQHFEEALEMNTRLGARPYLAHTQHDYARMLIDRHGPGDRDKAFRLLTEAIAMYRDIGMPKHLEMAEALLAEV
ncbi:MAG: tetratricopeptide repeat protein, partial [Dehalococcoidia bacterium]